ncbi:MAG TPA: class F sortase [Segeticoccus sp.]|nr:class F sortase [Segeticoccus sp.]
MSTGPHPTGRGVGRRAAVVACVLLVVLGAALVGWVLTHQTSAPQAQLVSSADAAQEAQPRPTPAPAAPSASSTPGPAGRSTATPSDPPSHAGASPHHSTASKSPASRGDQHRDLPASRPVRVVIPSIDVSSRLQRLGVTRDGSIEVPAPPRYNEAGWFTGSPTPGEDGPSVILGHIDGVGTTPSVFFDLGAVQSGDTVKVTRADGRTVTFTVYRTERYRKDDFPTAVVYGNTQRPELRLITCGGTVNPETGHYRDNTVVYARMTHVTKG